MKTSALEQTAKKKKKKTGKQDTDDQSSAQFLLQDYHRPSFAVQNLSL
jgi:hypothetical protein